MRLPTAADTEAGIIAALRDLAVVGRDGFSFYEDGEPGQHGVLTLAWRLAKGRKLPADGEDEYGPITSLRALAGMQMLADNETSPGEGGLSALQQSLESAGEDPASATYVFVSFLEGRRWSGLLELHYLAYAAQARFMVWTAQERGADGALSPYYITSPFGYRPNPPVNNLLMVMVATREGVRPVFLPIFKKDKTGRPDGEAGRPVLPSCKDTKGARALLAAARALAAVAPATAPAAAPPVVRAVPVPAAAAAGPPGSPAGASLAIKQEAGAAGPFSPPPTRSMPATAETPALKRQRTD